MGIPMMLGTTYHCYKFKHTQIMTLQFKNLCTLVAISGILLFTSCKSDDDNAPTEDEFFTMVIDGTPVSLSAQSATDADGDNSLFVSGGQFPDDVSITLVSNELMGVGVVTCADNQENYSVRLVINNGTGNSVTSYDDGEDTCESVITISRFDSYIEGNFTSFVRENSSSDPEVLLITGDFKVRADN